MRLEQFSRPTWRLALPLTLTFIATLVLAACGQGAATPEPAEPTAAPTVAATAAPAAPAAPRIVFVAADRQVVSGECTDLSWETENAVAVYLDGRGVEAADSKEVCPTETTTYTLTAVVDSGEEFSRTVVVDVTALAETATVTPEPTSTIRPVTNTPAATAVPTATPTPEVFVSFYAKDNVYDIPASDLCTEVIWETRGVTDVALEQEGRGRTGVAVSGRQEVCFEDDKVKFSLFFKLPDGREDRRDIEIRRED